MKQKRIAFGLLVIAALVFAILNIFNRLVPKEIGTIYQLFLKVILQSAMFCTIGIVSRSFTKINVRDWPLLVFRGLLFVVDYSSYFIAINHLPLGTTLFLFYAGSTTTSYIYGYFILHERLNAIKIISLFLAVLGLIVIFNENLIALSNVAAIFAVLSGICFGLQISTSKNLTDKYSVVMINFIACFIAIFLTIPVLLLSHERVVFPISPYASVVFFFFAFLTTLAFYLTIYGFKYMEAQRGSLILLAELPFTIIVGLLVYSEIPSFITFLGGILIVCSLILPNIDLSTLKILPQSMRK